LHLFSIFSASVVDACGRERMAEDGDAAEAPVAMSWLS
jgi:hypothetical protein